MAEQDKSTAPEAAEDGGVEDGGVEDAQDTSSSSSYFTKIIVPLFMLASLGLGGWIAYAQYSSVDQVVKVAQESFSSMWAEEKGIQYGEFMELENIIVNPAGTQGQRYLMVALGLEASSSAALTEVENKEIVVRDTVLKTLSQYNVQQLASIEHRDKTKKELINAVNGVLGTQQIDRLYFTQYVLQ